MESLMLLFHYCCGFIFLATVLHLTGRKAFKLFPRVDEFRFTNVLISVTFIVAVFLVIVLILSYEIVSLFNYITS